MQRFRCRSACVALLLLQGVVFPAFASNADTGDLANIRFQRNFRILIPVPENRTEGAAQTEFRTLLNKFADEQFLNPAWIQVARRQDLIPELMAGKGDLIAAPISIDEYRLHGATYSNPIRKRREALVFRKNTPIKYLNDLGGRRLAIRERSGYWQQLHRLRHLLPNLDVEIIPQQKPADSILDAVRDMRLDVALVDTSGLMDAQLHWPQLRILHNVYSSASIAFGLHPQAVELKAALDDFLSREQFAKQSLFKSRGDLPAIKNRGILRVLTHNNATDYFIWRGRPRGFEYRLMAKFAEEQRLQLKIIVPEMQDQFVPKLLAGDADVIAASMPIKPKEHHQAMAFSHPYRQHHGVIVSKSTAADILDIAGLAGRTLTVRRDSIDWTVLSRYQDNGVNFKLFAAPTELDSEELIERVANGLYDLAVVGRDKLNAVLHRRQDVKALYTMPEAANIGWAVRAGNPKLLKALNTFINEQDKSLFYNMLHTRYFENPRPVRLLKEHRNNVLEGPKISPYDDIVRKEAADYGFDWPLIVALMYRESRFDPNVESWAGARGLMQVLPVTAKRFGIENLQDPQSSIRAGIRMLSWLYSRLADSLPVQERTWLALAAYNAGLGHVLDARALAPKLKLDPNRWFGNVEIAMRKLSNPKYYRKAKHGYVRGIEPVTYVRDIRHLYNIYRSFPRE